MNMEMLDTDTIYRQMLDTADAAEREALYRDALLAPFAGMFRAMGGGDALAMARGWALYGPDDCAGGAREHIIAMLDHLSAADSWERTAEAAERARAAFAPHAARIPLERITAALVLTDPARGTALDRGYSGFGGIPGYVMTTYSAADDYTLPRVGGATVHEINHNVRFALFPFNPMTVTVGAYSVAEGLAEAFAAELYGEEVVGYYVTDISEDDLATARRVIAGALDQTGFNTIRSYIFGDAISAQMGRPALGVPNFAGYATGYRAVRQYLARTGKSVAEATFVPADEIIAESGYFTLSNEMANG
jgi:uncharacterized protein YjaZ